MLTFKNIEIGFHSKKKKQLFKTEVLDFKIGEFMAVVGPNGSGKTTLFNTILGNTPLLSGEITWGGKNLEAIPPKEKAKLISFVPSKFEGINHLSVYELIAMGRAPYTNILHRLTKNDHQIISSIIEHLGLEKLKDKNSLFLSDGERQIAMIGKAMAQETDIIILDEPTAFLDYNNREKVLQILENIALKKKKMIFISSHNLALCTQYCNRILGIEKQQHKVLDFQGKTRKEVLVQKIFGTEL